MCSRTLWSNAEEALFNVNPTLLEAMKLLILPVLARGIVLSAHDPLFPTLGIHEPKVT